MGDTRCCGHSTMSVKGCPLQPEGTHELGSPGKITTRAWQPIAEGHRDHIGWHAPYRTIEGMPAMTSASTMVERRCATTIVVRFFMRLSSAFCTRCSLALSRALVACAGNLSRQACDLLWRL